MSYLAAFALASKPEVAGTGIRVMRITHLQTISSNCRGTGRTGAQEQRRGSDGDAELALDLTEVADAPANNPPGRVFRYLHKIKLIETQRHCNWGLTGSGSG